MEIAIQLSYQEKMKNEELEQEIEYNLDNVEFQEEERYQFQDENEPKDTNVPGFHLNFIQPIYYYTNEKMY